MKIINCCGRCISETHLLSNCGSGVSSLTCFYSLKNSTDLSKINGIWREPYSLELCAPEYPCAHSNVYLVSLRSSSYRKSYECDHIKYKSIPVADLYCTLNHKTKCLRIGSRTDISCWKKKFPEQKNFTQPL